jgi:hypothetical protein
LAIALSAAFIGKAAIGFAAPQSDLGAKGVSASQSLWNKDEIQVAQVCGWFAILGCFSDPRDAYSWNECIREGYVVDTTRMDYPTFQAGFYCVVSGPMNEHSARAVAIS